jgi:hypothetical protein
MSKTQAPTALLQLSTQTPFSKGGNRLCFVHPKEPKHCLKVLIPESLPEVRRRKKSFPANLRPLKYFDENLQEMHALSSLSNNYPERITKHLPQSFGIVATDMGDAHQVSLIRDWDNRISQTLEQYLWANGMDETVKEALKRFNNDWLAGAPTTRDLLPHNLVLQLSKGQQANLVLIDGYGRKGRIPTPSALIYRKNRIQMERLNDRVTTVLNRKQNNESPKPRISQLNREL